jgi:hypothetical protein
MKCKAGILVVTFLFAMSFVFAGCNSLGTDTANGSTGVQGVSNTNGTNGTPADTATYRYIDPTAVVSVTRTGGTNHKWKVLNSNTDETVIKKIANLVNSGIARRQSTQKEMKPVNDGLLTGISLKFNDATKTIVDIWGVYPAAKKGNLGKPSKDLYLFEVTSGSNKTFFTISSKSMVNYLLKGIDKDLPKAD